ncbi:MAG: hypothetical protein KDD40_00720, partial [Bdellovibrionales bacterium]|nr:hypothetical protein [Bdellovibrionales bacterium]
NVGNSKTGECMQYGKIIWALLMSCLVMACADDKHEQDSTPKPVLKKQVHKRRGNPPIIEKKTIVNKPSAEEEVHTAAKSQSEVIISQELPVSQRVQTQDPEPAAEKVVTLTEIIHQYLQKTEGHLANTGRQFSLTEIFANIEVKDYTPSGRNFKYSQAQTIVFNFIGHPLDIAKEDFSNLHSTQQDFIDVYAKMKNKISPLEFVYMHGYLGLLEGLIFTYENLRALEAEKAPLSSKEIAQKIDQVSKVDDSLETRECVKRWHKGEKIINNRNKCYYVLQFGTSEEAQQFAQLSQFMSYSNQLTSYIKHYYLEMDYCYREYKVPQRKVVEGTVCFQRLKEEPQFVFFKFNPQVYSAIFGVI